MCNFQKTTPDSFADVMKKWDQATPDMITQHMEAIDTKIQDLEAEKKLLHVVLEGKLTKINRVGMEYKP